MTLRILRPLLVLALAWPALLPLPAAPPAVTAVEPDWAALIGTYPPLGSKQEDEEKAIMLWLQRTRTGADVARAVSEVQLSPALFAQVLGEGFDAASRPRTFALLEQVWLDSRSGLGPLKKRFSRPRPFLTVPALEPAVPREQSFSYPSGHATTGELFGSILAELVPASAKALLERGAQIGNDRVLGGVHWPSDVEAGQKLGSAFAAYWLGVPEHQALVAEVRAAEWH